MTTATETKTATATVTMDRRQLAAILARINDTAPRCHPTVVLQNVLIRVSDQVTFTANSLERYHVEACSPESDGKIDVLVNAQQLRKVVRRRLNALINAQPHRCTPIVGLQDGLPVLWPVIRESLNEPVRMGEARLVIRRLALRDVLAAEVAQYGVYQRREFWLAQNSCRLDCHRHGGMIRYPGIGQLIEAGTDKTLDDAVATAQWAVKQHRQPGSQLPVLT